MLLTAKVSKVFRCKFFMSLSHSDQLIGLIWFDGSSSVQWKVIPCRLMLLHGKMDVMLKVHSGNDRVEFTAFNSIMMRGKHPAGHGSPEGISWTSAASRNFQDCVKFVKMFRISSHILSDELRPSIIRKTTSTPDGVIVSVAR